MLFSFTSFSSFRIRFLVSDEDKEEEEEEDWEVAAAVAAEARRKRIRKCEHNLAIISQSLLKYYQLISTKWQVDDLEVS